MSNIYFPAIKEMAEKIKAQIAEGQLYGQPVNMDDPDALIVAAYLIGEQHATGGFLEQEARRKSLYGLSG